MPQKTSPLSQRITCRLLADLSENPERSDFERAHDWAEMIDQELARARQDAVEFLTEAE